MRLSTINTQYYLGAFVGILIIHGLISYGLVTYFVHQRIEKALLKEKRTIQRAIDEADTIPDFPGFGENEFSISLQQSPIGKKDEFKTVSLYSLRDEEELEYYELATQVNKGSSIYEVRIRRSLVRTQELILSLVASSFFALLLILLSWFLFFRKLDLKLWAPFFSMLHQLKRIDLREGEEIDLPETQIWEFQQLNDEVNKLTEKLGKDYMGQKHFIENASHELQTPLAIIKTQLELILQSEKLDEVEIRQIASCIDAADRLTRINKSLISLSRIENLHYIEKERLYLEEVIEHNMSIFRMEAESREITINYEINNPCELLINDTLAHMLVRNLIQNAIRHNVEKGEIWIILNASSLVIKNTGKVTDTPSEKFFERFYKSSDSEGSIGLGLAIVKEICELYDFQVSYDRKDSLHVFTIDIPSPKNSQEKM